MQIHQFPRSRPELWSTPVWIPEKLVHQSFSASMTLQTQFVGSRRKTQNIAHREFQPILGQWIIVILRRGRMLPSQSPSISCHSRRIRRTNALAPITSALDPINTSGWLWEQRNISHLDCGCSEVATVRTFWKSSLGAVRWRRNPGSDRTTEIEWKKMQRDRPRG
jgi:hypothetical protein